MLHFSDVFTLDFIHDLFAGKNLLALRQGISNEASILTVDTKTTFISTSVYNTTNIYLFRVSTRNTIKRGAISSKSTITIQERRLLRGSGVFIATSEHISHLFIVFLLLTLNRLAGKFAHDRIIKNKTISSQIIIT